MRALRSMAIFAGLLLIAPAWAQSPGKCGTPASQELLAGPLPQPLRCFA